MITAEGVTTDAVAAAGPRAGDPTAADQTGADQTGADPAGADPAGADPTTAEPTSADPVPAEPAADEVSPPAPPDSRRSPFPGEVPLRWLARKVGLGRLRRAVAARRSAVVQRFYGADYFERAERRQPGVSGYGSYTRANSNADVASYLLWRFLPFTRSLDVGCAKGFLVEGLVELGYDAYGWDLSEWAVSGADESVQGRLSVVDLERRQWKLRQRPHDLVTALEVLEHVRPEQVPRVLRRLRRVCDGYLVATIPSIGANPNGPDGFPEGKVRTERLEHYKALGPGYDGPVPFDDLIRDDAGNPVEGHVTVASFAWWTRQFERAGFVRQPEVERAMHPVIGRFDLSVAWNLYVFHVDRRASGPMVVRTEDELAELERRWHLAERQPSEHSRNFTELSVGTDAVAAIEREHAASRARAERLA